MINTTKYPKHLIIDLLPLHLKENYFVVRCEGTFSGVKVHLTHKKGKNPITHTIPKHSLEFSLYLSY